MERYIRNRRKHTQSSFAQGLNFYKLAWVFLAGCLIGYIIEMIWCYTRNGYFESRQGLLYGPFSPVYGLGAILYTVVLSKLTESNSAVIFFCSALIGGAFEYVCSFAQEKVFGTVSWEYSEYPLNLHGRINVAYSLCWGVLGIIFVKHTLPFLNRWIERIPRKTGTLLTWVLLLFLLADVILSAAAVRRQTDRHNQIPAQNVMSQFLDEHYDDAYLQKVYPNMQIVP